MPSGKTNETNVIEGNISYYNEVAGIYNQIMHDEKTNHAVRNTVKEKFLEVVEPGWILDFGGGTGLDLQWLTEKYNILFCEPSEEMRRRAIDFITDHLQKSNVVFLEPPKTDFTRWPMQRPFVQKVNGILANFGVSNYIPNIEQLFTSLATVIKPGGHMVTTIIHLNFQKKWKWHRRNAIVSFITGKTFKMYIPYKEHKQTVFVHSVDEIKKASSKYFEFKDTGDSTSFGFTLIHLIRNENVYPEMAAG